MSDREGNARRDQGEKNKPRRRSRNETFSVQRPNVGSKPFKRFDLIENCSLVFGTATRVATNQNAGFVQALKSVGASWFKVTLKAMKDILIKTLSIAKKLNVAALSAVTFNLGGSIEYMSQLVSDAIMLVSAVSWILVNLNILYGLVALVGWVSGSALTPYMGIAIDEFRRFVYSILIDATLLPVRSLWYVLRGVSEQGDFNTLVLKEGQRPWWSCGTSHYPFGPRDCF